MTDSKVYIECDGNNFKVHTQGVDGKQVVLMYFNRENAEQFVKGFIHQLEMNPPSGEYKEIKHNA